MLLDDDLEWYSTLLAKAAVGIAKITILDASRIGKCGKAAAGDVRLPRLVMQKLSKTYAEAFPI